MPREVFIAGQILTAAEMNSVSDQTVMVFAGTAARGSAIPTPTEGMVTYLSDVNQVQAYTGAAFKPVSSILQVVSTTKTDTFTTSSTSFTDVTGLSASITPSSASSKVLVTASIMASATESASFFVRLLRDSTDISLGDAAGSRTRVIAASYPGSASGVSSFNTISVVFLDSPSATSATTYKLQVAASSATTIAVNRGTTDTDSAGFQRSTSTITLMEVAG